MELNNCTKMTAGYTMGMDSSGQEYVIIVTKGTFIIPASSDMPVEYAEQQIPLTEADVFTGEPAFSAMLYENDYALRKKYCDVILNGSAYAPGGNAATSVNVGLQVGKVNKSFKVIGKRVWEVGLTGIGPSAPEAFTQMPISYDCAFGGVDNFHADEEKHSTYIHNPAGTGFHQRLSPGLVDGTPVSNTELATSPVNMPNGNYKPMAFGSIGRGWPARAKYAGTYDDAWLDNVFPFLPSDFRDEYYQTAPADQQTDYLQGGELVKLTNLTQEGYREFRIPNIEVPVTLVNASNESNEYKTVADTLIIEPDKNTFSIVWRMRQPLKRNFFELLQAYVGQPSRGWYVARQHGKQYYASLDDVYRDRQAEL